MAATHNARNQEARLDEVIRGEYHAQARAQQPVREAHGRAECAVAFRNNDRQRSHHDVRRHLTECERFEDRYVIANGGTSGTRSFRTVVTLRIS